MTDDIPLDISGHEERDPPDGFESLLDGSDTDGESQQGATESESYREATESESQQDTSEDTKDIEREESEAEVEPVEVLVQLAEDGEIDPWDIDIVEVTDKFLERIDNADLGSSGRALFYASVLLRMKGDAMLREDDDEPEPEPWEAMLEGGEIEEPMGDPFSALEQEMDRRLERKRARGMPQTLDELVRDLRDAERDSWWKESREYDTSRSSTRQQPQQLDYHAADEFRMDDEPTAADVTERTHGEDIETVLADVSTALREQYEQGRVEVLFREVATAGGSPVETFLGLLFLAHRGEVRLQQDELFGDLWIQDPNATTGSGEALAD